MSVTMSQRRKRAAKSPDETGTTTPAGIAANDPDVEDEAGWTQLRPLLRQLIHLPKGTVRPKDHLLAVQLEERAIVLPDELLAAGQLVAKYFPRESWPSAGSAPPREFPPAESITQGEKKVAAGPPPSRTLSRVTLEYCVRHPDNRIPAAADIEARARSIEQHGLEHPPTVRPLPPDHPHVPHGWKHPHCWQILSGETRILALRKLGRRGEIDAHLRPCSDAEALVYLARDNAERTDLNPIEKARLIKRLCEAPEVGGSGMTRQQAAELYGLKDESSASNLVRLLDLPPVWQERVLSGELPQSFARLLLPYAHAPKLMEAIDAEWKKAHGPKAYSWERERWENREEFEAEVAAVVENQIRPMDGKTTHRYSHEQVGAYGHKAPRLFDVTDELREKLGVVTLELSPFGSGGKKREMEVATDAALFDKLNIPLVKQKLAKKTTRQAAKAGKEDKPAKRELTAAEKKRREQEKARQLAARIDQWRRRWLASLVLDTVDEDHVLASWLALLVAAGQLHRPRENYMLAKQPPHPVAIVLRNHGASHKHDDLFEMCQQLSGDQVVFGEVLAEGAAAIAKELLAAAASDGFSPLDYEQVDALAVYVEINLAEEWKALQYTTACPPQYEAFFQLHQNAQLDALGEELGVKVDHVQGKEQKIHLLTSCQRQLKLPKCIKPLAARKSKVASSKSKSGKK